MSSLKGAMRTVKVYTKGYSQTKTQVRQATCSDPWGPTGIQMNEISQLTYNQDSFVEVVEALDKRLNDKGKQWRHVFKALTVIDYLLHAGSENVVLYFKDNVYVIRTLKEFQYIDEQGKDEGSNVRKKAADISNLLLDEARLRRERLARANMRGRMIRGAADGPDGEELLQKELRQSDEQLLRNELRFGEDDDVARALKATKKAEATARAKAAGEKATQDALKESAEEEARRAKEVEESNARPLFDEQQDNPPPMSPPTPMGNQNPFPFTDPAAYTSGLIIPQMQPQLTNMQPQFNSFNPFFQQQAQQAEFMRQQQQMLDEQQRLQAEHVMMMQQHQMAQHHQEMDLFQQQQQQQQMLAPQPPGFGSRNPFAPASAASLTPLPPSPIPPMQNQPSFTFENSFEASNRPQSSFSAGSHESAASTLSPVTPTSPAFPPAPTKADIEHGKLASLFANRVDDGQDTFGNYGALRYGPTSAGRAVQKTGNNPFLQAQPQVQVNDDRPFF